MALSFQVAVPLPTLNNYVVACFFLLYTHDSNAGGGGRTWRHTLYTMGIAAAQQCRAVNGGRPDDIYTIYIINFCIFFLFSVT